MSRLDRVGISCTVAGNIVVYRTGPGSSSPLETKDVTLDAIRTVVEYGLLQEEPMSFIAEERGKRCRITLTVTQEELPDDHT